MKPTQLSGHALSCMNQRGFTVAEVEEAIRESSWQPAGLGRLECRKAYPFHKEWNNKFYDTKEVRPISVVKSW